MSQTVVEGWKDERWSWRSPGTVPCFTRGKRSGMASEIQTVTLAGQAFEIGERSEFEPLRA
jgi:hypothetical protein